MTKKQNYISKDVIFEHFQQAKQGGDQTPFVLDCYKIIDHVLGGHRFKDYPYDLKRDFRQEAVIKCLRALTNFDETKSRNVFGFITCTVQRSILDQLRKYYRYVNNRKKFLKDVIGSEDEEFCRSKLKEFEDNTWKEFFNEK